MNGSAEAHPDPPSDLAERSVSVRHVAAPMYRFHSRGRNPLYFGRLRTYRFDDPEGAYGVMYVGLSLDAAFLETFGRTGSRVVTRSELEAKSLAVVHSSRSASVVDLAAEGALARIGADARLFAGDREVAQRWSRAIRSLPSTPDGILYPTRREPRHAAIALFDHVEEYLEVELRGSMLEAQNAAMLGEILDRYGLGLLDDP